MGKMIVVWGSPDSGKTSFAVKLAGAIYSRYNTTVLVLSCNQETPALPVIFPNYKREELFSVGIPLSKTDMTQGEIIKSIVTLKGKGNLGFLGYKDEENKYTYPAYDSVKAHSFLEVLKSLTDFVIVDCTSNLENILSEMAVREADTVFRLASPTLKSLSFFSSQLSLYADPMYRLERQIVGLNCTEADCYMPVEEVKSCLKNVAFTLPYCHEIRQQAADGELTKDINDKKYSLKLKAIADRVVDNEQ